MSRPESMSWARDGLGLGKWRGTCVLGAREKSQEPTRDGKCGRSVRCPPGPRRLFLTGTKGKLLGP